MTQWFQLLLATQWLQFLLAITAIPTLIGVIWCAVWIARLSARISDLSLVVQECEKGLNPREVVSQLKTLANENQAVTEQLLAAVAQTSKLVAELAGDQMQQLLVNLARLGVAIDEGSATSKRIESAAIGVAEDLSNAHARADKAAHDGEAGAAADAAARQTNKEKRMAEES